MRTETIKIDLYSFDELSDSAKQSAIESLYDLNVDHEWWDCIYADAVNIGCEINGFDLGRGSYCDLFCMDTEVTAHLILDNHGDMCETYKTAQIFIYYCSVAVNSTPDDELSDKFDELSKEFIYSLSEDYRLMLQREYDYLTSKEAIIETINCNEYEFTVDGKLY
jgi:hypothetical protein